MEGMMHGPMNLEKQLEEVYTFKQACIESDKKRMSRVWKDKK